MRRGHWPAQPAGGDTVVSFGFRSGPIFCSLDAGMLVIHIKPLSCCLGSTDYQKSTCLSTLLQRYFGHVLSPSNSDEMQRQKTHIPANRVLAKTAALWECAHVSIR